MKLFLCATGKILTGFLVVMLVLIATYVTVGRLVVLQLNNHRIYIEEELKKLSSIPVHIGRIEGLWEGFYPKVIVYDLQIGLGDDALKFKKLSALVDTFSSLLHQRIQISSLAIDGLNIRLSQTNQGQWNILGLSSIKKQSSSDIPISKILQQINSVSLLNSHLNIITPSNNYQLTLDTTLSGEYKDKQLDAYIKLPNDQCLSLLLKGHLNRKDWKKSEVELYANLPETEWSKWIPKNLFKDLQLNTLNAGGDIWLSLNHGTLNKAVAHLNIPELSVQKVNNKKVVLNNIKLNSYLFRNRDKLTLLVDHLSAVRNHTKLTELNLIATQYKNEKNKPVRSLSLDHLDIKPWLSLITKLVPLPEKVVTKINILQPTGMLNNATISYTAGMDWRAGIKISANLSQVGFSSMNEIPAVRHINGSVSGALGHGSVNVASRKFSLHLADIFPEAWVYKQVNGQFCWDITNDYVTLSSPYIKTQGGEGNAGIDFLIRLSLKNINDSYMDLRVALKNGEASYTQQYLPSLLSSFSPDLTAWLTGAIKKGNINKGLFYYQGSLSPDAKSVERNLGLYFAVDNVDLFYQKGWPLLKAAKANVAINDQKVDIKLSKGQVLDSQLHKATAEVMFDGSASKGPWLRINGQADSTVKDALIILQTPGLDKSITRIFSGWKGSGAISGDMDMNVPLYKTKVPPKVIVDFFTKDAQLNLPQPFPGLSKIQGKFRYDTSKGLSAPNVSAVLLNHTVHGDISASENNKKVMSLFNMTGSVSIDDLSSKFKLPALPVVGLLPYRMKIRIGDDINVHLESDLKGVAVHLPKPFNKKMSTTKPFSANFHLADGEQSYHVRYGKLASIAFSAPASHFLNGRGELLLGGAHASLPAENGIQVRGGLSVFDLSLWQKVLSSYATTSDDNKTLRLLRRVHIKIDQFKGVGHSVRNVLLKIDHTKYSWRFGINSSPLTGKIVLSSDKTRPIEVMLDHLQLPRPLTAPNSSIQKDVFVGVDPRLIPSVNLDIKDVQYGHQHFGRWSLKLRHKTQGIELQNISLGLSGLALTGNLTWFGNKQVTSTSYKGKIQGRNIKSIYKKWGVPPMATGENFRLDIDSTWPGSPANFSLKSINGRFKLKMKKGQLLEVKGSASALRVFGLLNLSSIRRRLHLDFSDLTDQGLSYDRITGILKAKNGIFVTSEPIKLKGPSANLKFDGIVNMPDHDVDASLLVEFPISGNLPAAAVIAGFNPAVGGALLVFNHFMGDSVSRVASIRYYVQGSPSSPSINLTKASQKN